MLLSCSTSLTSVQLPLLAASSSSDLSPWSPCFLITLILYYAASCLVLQYLYTWSCIASCSSNSILGGWYAIRHFTVPKESCCEVLAECLSARRLLGTLDIWMACGKTEGWYTIWMKWPSGCSFSEKQINKHRKEADLPVFIGDEVIATDFRIPSWCSLFPLHTANNPFIS